MCEQSSRFKIPVGSERVEFMRRLTDAGDVFGVCEALKQDGTLLCYVGEQMPDGTLGQTPEMCRIAFEQNKNAFPYMKFRTREDWVDAVKYNGWFISYLHERDEELMMLAIKQDAMVIGYMNNPTPEMCLEAVRSNPHALIDLQDQTHELCLEAVRRDGTALEHVKEEMPNGVLGQSDEVVRAAIDQTPEAFFYVKNQMDWCGYFKGKYPEYNFKAILRSKN